MPVSWLLTAASPYTPWLAAASHQFCLRYHICLCFSESLFPYKVKPVRSFLTLITSAKYFPTSSPSQLLGVRTSTFVLGQHDSTHDGCNNRRGTAAFYLYLPRFKVSRRKCVSLDNSSKTMPLLCSCLSNHCGWRDVTPCLPGPSALSSS